MVTVSPMTDHKPITDAQLSEWRAVTEAATSGPWTTHISRAPEVDTTFAHILLADDVPLFDCYTDDGEYIALSEADARFIALSRTALPALLDEVGRLRRAAEEVLNAVEPNDTLGHPTMTEDDALSRCDQIDKRRQGDNEGHHADYDDLLLDAIDALGWTRLADRYANHNDVTWCH